MMRYLAFLLVFILFSCSQETGMKLPNEVNFEEVLYERGVAYDLYKYDIPIDDCDKVIKKTVFNVNNQDFISFREFKSIELEERKQLNNILADISTFDTLNLKKENVYFATVYTQYDGGRGPYKFYYLIAVLDTNSGVLYKWTYNGGDSVPF